MRKSYIILNILIFVTSFISCKLFADQANHGDEFCTRCNQCNDNNFFTSRTFMMTRPVSHNIRAEQSLWHDFLYSKRDKGGSFQIITFYQQSINDQRYAKYFTLEGKSLMRVFGDDNNDVWQRDIRAEWIGLPSNFRGSFSLNPEQMQFATSLVYNQDLKSFVKSDFLKRFWLEFSFPFVVVENSLNLCQCDIFNESQSYPRDIKQALNNCCWLYGRIGGKKSCFGCAPVTVKLGGAFMDDGNDQIVSYCSLVIPTGKQDDDRFLFEPLPDYNGHWGLSSGVNFQFALNRENSDKIDFCFFLNFEALFLVEAYHRRTFDLKSVVSGCNTATCGASTAAHCAPCDYKRKQWSRYLMFNAKGGAPDQNVPGVDILTKNVKVRPYGIFDFSCGFKLIKLNKFELELGYGIWGHGSEKIECVKNFDQEWGIAGIKQPGDTFARSASLSTIAQQIATDVENDPTDPVFIPICITHLDLDSGAAQGSLNHIIDLAGGLEHVGEAVDVFFGAGVYYEWPQKNSSLENLGAWLKLGGSF
jgi:hypothetical protein